jgi:hypothetical protein
MKNAHERFGTLEFTKRMKDTETRIRVTLDRFAGEALDRPGATAQAHVVSVTGSDVDVGAVWAAIMNQESFTIFGPGLEVREVTLGPNPKAFRGTISVTGRKRGVRHLVAISAPAADETDCGRTILLDGSPDFALYFLSHRLGLPVHPSWSTWLWKTITRHGRVEPLDGLGCQPITISGNKQEFLEWIASGLRQDEIRIPNDPGPLAWPRSHQDLAKPVATT